MRHRVMPWIAGLSTAIITTLAAVTAQAAQPFELTVLESTPGFFDLPLRNAIADFAPKLNLNVKLITVTGGGGLATEFEGGTGDIAMVAADTPLRLVQANAVPGGVTIVGTNMTNMLYALVAKQGSPYHALADLKGTNVGITGGRICRGGAKSRAGIARSRRTGQCRRSVPRTAFRRDAKACRHRSRAGLRSRGLPDGRILQRA
jgi:ABC-type nitrate/sulfonate/bicarbonate transport system substrate-binding protein